MMKPTPIAAALALAVALGACVPSMGTATREPISVEQMKQDIAAQRDSGQIGYEEAARRQYDIQRQHYSMSRSDHAFWQESIGHARAVDQGRIDDAEYRRRVAASLARNS